jgi:peroxiredoxin
MSAHTILYPRQPVPDLSVPTVGGGTWSLAGQSPENFTMVVFYRGYHCPICSRYLGDLERRLDKFADLGVTAIAISSDGQERAEKAKSEWEITNLTMGYDFSLDEARKWGLFISTSKGKTTSGVEESPMFIEPGLFFVRPDNTLYWSSIQTMPFARPSFAEIQASVQKVLEMDYPARGQVIDHKAEAAE